MAVKVNYLIVGAQKAGTTALASFLGQHPDICMAPRKELHVFDAPDYEDTDTFCDERFSVAFPNYTGQRCVGEASPFYMYAPEVAPRIQRYNPRMKLLILLRNPVERALSHYKWEVSRRTESLPLGLALLAERIRLWRAGRSLDWYSAVRVHSYIDRGFYSRQLQHLSRHFSKDQMLILRTDSLQARHVETLERVYDFLGVERPAAFPEPRSIRPTPETGILDTSIEPSALARTLLSFVFRLEVRRLELLLGWQLDDWR